MVDVFAWIGITILQAFYVLALVFVALVLCYVFVRVVSFAAVRSWFQVSGYYRRKRREKMRS